MDYEKKVDLIAPCGINCRTCIAYQFGEHDFNKRGFHKKYCDGCIPRGGTCTHMGDSCELLRKGSKDGGVRFCFECEKFPCKRLKSLDKRYSTKYNTSVINNLNFIKNNGMNAFLEKEDDKWKCGTCGGSICCHNGLCLTCNLDILIQDKKYKNQK